jgi:hypothetical protein
MPGSHFGWLQAFVVIVLAGFAFAGDAAAGQYTCEVPIAVLCQGCATGVSIRLDRNGGCRVSFNPTSSAAAPVLAGAVPLRILTPTAPRVPAFRRRIAYGSRVGTKQPSLRGACFTFNGQEYCE